MGKHKNQNDNSSDDESVTKKETVIRSRGRPRKNQIQSTNKKKSVSNLDQSNTTQKKSIYLNIPLSDDSSETSETSNKNHFTAKEEFSDDDNNNKEKLFLYLSDNDSDSDDEDDIEESEVNSFFKTKKKGIESFINLKSNSCMNNKNNRDECVNNSIYSVSMKKNPDDKFIKSNVFPLNKEDKCLLKEKQNIRCWWCTCNFDNIPCFIPDKFSDGKYHVYGCFCSYNCALAYALNPPPLYDDRKNSHRVALTKKLYAELYKTNELLFPSPAKELLKEYGGKLTVEQYRKESCKLENKKHKLKLDNLDYIPLCVEVD